MISSVRCFIPVLLCIALLVACSPKAVQPLSRSEKADVKKYRSMVSTNDGCYHILITTPKGNMVVKLLNETPLHRDNFVKLVQRRFYDSLLFHRVINNFMIQGGDPDSKHAADTAKLGNGEVADVGRIPAEFRLDKSIYHTRGALAAARDNNPEKASSNCQFYIVHRMPWRPAQLDSHIVQRKLTLNAEQKKLYTTVGGAPHLDGNYTVFGHLEIGYDVLDSIATTKTKPGDRPVADIRMKMYLLSKPKLKK
ncbi:MAG TPA: peptidylprolyl isomerase [Phnomibacter sp.]|nr:peptidylprolyl isomerase [Phnomibacter sp.]